VARTARRAAFDGVCGACCPCTDPAPGYTRWIDDTSRFEAADEDDADDPDVDYCYCDCHYEYIRATERLTEADWAELMGGPVTMTP
jgi:hypothetical protein